MNGQNLPWVNGMCSFYRELVVGLLVWIHLFGSTCLDPLSSWMIWVVNGENGVCGAKSKESIPCSKSNVSWYDYVKLLEYSS